MQSVTISKVLSYVALHHHMEDLHEVTSIYFMCWSELTECLSKYRVTRNESLLGIPINNHGSFSSKKFFQQILVVGLQTVPSTNSEYGQIHHNPSDQFWHS